jgi:hypothetical protein
MFTGESTWSLGVLLGIPILLVVLGGFVSVTIWAWRRRRHDDYNDGELRWVGWFFLAAAIVIFLLALTPVGYYPFKAEYHQWREVTGQVTDVEKRLVKSGDGMEEKIVVTYEGGNEFGCLDTRCSTVEPGDTLTLTCKRSWQYAGVDGYDCNFVSKEEAGSS